MAEPTVESQVLEQLDSIYSKENLEKNAFFREMTEQDPDHWVSLKKFSVIKQFKELVKGDVEMFIRAAEQSEGRFEINEDKTKLRKAHVEEKSEEEIKEENARAVRDYMDVQNARSIYAKGFPINPKTPSRDVLIKFFKEFGRVLNLKMRTDEQKNFKGSVFVEFESADVAKEVIVKQLEYEGQELEIMSKQEYIDMKAREKYQGVAFQNPAKENYKNTYLIQYEGSGEMSFKEIRELLGPKAKIGNVEPLSEKGTGVVELQEQTPEQFLESLGEERKLGDLVFYLADAEARDVMFAAKDKRKRFNKQRGGRGGGRGGRGRGGFRGGHRGGKRHGPNGDDRSEKRARTD